MEIYRKISIYKLGAGITSKVSPGITSKGITSELKKKDITSKNSGITSKRITTSKKWNNVENQKVFKIRKKNVQIIKKKTS